MISCDYIANKINELSLSFGNIMVYNGDSIALIIDGQRDSLIVNMYPGQTVFRSLHNAEDTPDVVPQYYPMDLIQSICECMKEEEFSIETLYMEKSEIHNAITEVVAQWFNTIVIVSVVPLGAKTFTIDHTEWIRATQMRKNYIRFSSSYDINTCDVQSDVPSSVEGAVDWIMDRINKKTTNP